MRRHGSMYQNLIAVGASPALWLAIGFFLGVVLEEVILEDGLVVKKVPATQLDFPLHEQDLPEVLEDKLSEGERTLYLARRVSALLSELEALRSHPVFSLDATTVDEEDNLKGVVPVKEHFGAIALGSGKSSLAVRRLAAAPGREAFEILDNAGASWRVSIPVPTAGGTPEEAGTSSFSENHNRLLLFSGRSKFQKVEFTMGMNGNKPDFDTVCLHLNGWDQSCSDDEFIYHESLVHPPFLLHPNPRQVLIAGGAEGATVREALRHWLIRNITFVDLDGELVDLCTKYLPASYRGVDTRHRVDFHAHDILGWLKKNPEKKFDIIIWDLVDIETGGKDSLSAALSKMLYGMEALSLIVSHLNPGGVFQMQAGEFDTLSSVQMSTLKNQLEIIRKHFKHVHLSSAYTPCFLNPWTYIMATNDDYLPSPISISPQLFDSMIAERVVGDLKYLDGVSHLSNFLLPLNAREQLGLQPDGTPVDRSVVAHRREKMVGQPRSGQKSEEAKKLAALQAEEEGTRVPVHTSEQETMYHVPLVGHHVIGEFYGSNPVALGDVDQMVAIIQQSLAAANANLMHLSKQKFGSQGGGMTIVGILSESHISIHTWPEHKYGAVDVFTCGASADPYIALRMMADLLDTELMAVSSRPRGSHLHLQTLPGSIHEFRRKYVEPEEQKEGLKVKEAGPPKHKGLFANKEFKKGEVIMSYPVERDLMEWSEYTTSPTYDAAHRLTFGVNKWQDAKTGQDIGYLPLLKTELKNFDFLAHSCQPNCVYEDSSTVMAWRDISKGEQLTVDYRTFQLGPKWRTVVSCNGSLNEITGDDFLRPSVFQTYSPYMAEYMQEKLARITNA